MVSDKAGTGVSGFDQEALSTFFDMAGPEMRDALLAQMQQDLGRCNAALQDALATDIAKRDLDALCRTAHEVKGLAATLGATSLADTARQAEQACSAGDRAALEEILPALSRDSQQACASIMAMAAES